MLRKKQKEKQEYYFCS